jgi:hypothetical protein
MEKKIFGILLLIAGVVGLILAASYVLNAAGGVRDIKLIAIYGVLGLIFFFAGVSLIRTTKEKS